MVDTIYDGCHHWLFLLLLKAEAEDQAEASKQLYAAMFRSEVLPLARYRKHSGGALTFKSRTFLRWGKLCPCQYLLRECF